MIIGEQDELANQDKTHDSELPPMRETRATNPGADSIKKQYRPPKQDSSSDTPENPHDESYEPEKKRARKQPGKKPVLKHPAGVTKSQGNAAPTYSSQFHSDIKLIWKRYESHKQAVAKLNCQNQELADKNRELSKQLNSSQDKAAHLVLAAQVSNEDTKTLLQKHDELKAHCRRIQADVVRMSREKLDEAPHHVKVSDEEISVEWHKLVYNVGNLVSQFLTVPPEQVVSNPEDQALAQTIASCKAEPYMKKIHLQRLIWSFMVVNIFWNRTGAWAGELGAEFVANCYRLQDLNLDKAEELGIISKMKSTTAIESDKKLGVSQEAMKGVIDQVSVKLSIFAPSPPAKDLRKDISKLFYDAMYLQQILMKSKAIFIVGMPSREFRNRTRLQMGEMYDIEDYSTETGEHGAKKRELAISPFLGKYGAADGHSFHSGFILCKSKLVRWQHEPLISPSWSTEDLASI